MYRKRTSKNNHSYSTTYTHMTMISLILTIALMAFGVVDIRAWSIPVRCHRRRPSVVLQSNGKSVESGTDDSLFNLFDSKNG